MEEKQYMYHIISSEGEKLYETNGFVDASLTRLLLIEKGFKCNITLNQNYDYSERKAESNNEHQEH